MDAPRPLRVLIVGSKGRMGAALIRCATKFSSLMVSAAVDADDDLEAGFQGAEVVIDFSFHEVTHRVAELSAKYSIPLVIGTTGHTNQQKTQILNSTSGIPVVWASNYSTGVNVLFWLSQQAARALGPTFDIEVVEMHHRLKKDAPSGTATTLVEILANERNLHLQESLRHGRSGIVGERQPTEIGMHALRGGDVVGDHTVIFAAEGERVELTHKASSRDTFANGALRAALWLKDQKPGIYSMQDVLGLSQNKP